MQLKSFRLFALGTICLGLAAWLPDVQGIQAEPAGGQEPAAAQEAAPKPTDGFDRELFLKSFDTVWQTIDEIHWDPEKTGAAWDEARARFRPLVEQAADAATARRAIEDLLKTLDQSHFGIIAADTYGEIEHLISGGGSGWCGLVIRLVQDRPMVVRVRTGSPAATAGVLPGLIVETIGETSAEQLIEGSGKLAVASFFRPETAFGLIADSVVTGPVGGKLKLVGRMPDGSSQEFSIDLVEGPGQPSKLGFLPTTLVEFRNEQLQTPSGEVGYLAFNAFLDGPRLSREFSSAIERARDSKGLVIDLRGNHGGLVALTMGMSGWLFAEKQSLGEMPAKRGTMKLTTNPRLPVFDAPVAILIDECSISAAEIMAAALQEPGRARVFGRRSAGMVLPSTVTRLPNGDGFQYALSDYVTAKGKRLEVEGVVPDQAIELDQASLHGADSRYGHDPDLQAAVQWILESGK